MKSGSPVNIHWPNVKKYGLIYVMLGRTERLEDIYISGELDVSKIVFALRKTPIFLTYRGWVAKLNYFITQITFEYDLTIF